MSDWKLFIELGFQHVWDWSGYDHLMFLLALCLPFLAREWKKLLILVSVFTLGHTLSLVLASFKIVRFDSAWIEFLIPVTILVTALYSIFIKRKAKNNYYATSITLFFGIIHGFGFASYFLLLSDGDTSFGWALVSFAVGIELAQLALAIFIMIINFMVLDLIRIKRRDWIQVSAGVVIGVLLPIIVERWP